TKKTIDPVVAETESLLEKREPALVKVEPSSEQPKKESEVINVQDRGRIIAKAINLPRATAESEPETQVSPGSGDGLRVLSETVTGPDQDMTTLGARGILDMRFLGESWIEVRDSRGRLVLADLMSSGRTVSLETYGPIEVLVGAVNSSEIVFNGERLDLSGRAFQNVARIKLGVANN
ncbi:DUF4115 domain-containing protein, partial [Litorivicinus sp.]|nr:DUF4115 domain-containing protein [Litorivicinus sp.]